MQFVDLQVNGYGGVDFNSDDLSDEQAALVTQRLRADGVASCMATVITAEHQSMKRRIGRVAELIEMSESFRSIIPGIHIEGPFISPVDGYVGAHPKSCVQEASIAAADELLTAGRGLVRLVTLAPEMDLDGTVTQWLSDQGIVVAAGHSDASTDQLRCAIDHGLQLFTHLGNGCANQLHRHDNIIQRVLHLADRLCISFIADGHHVPIFALKNYLQAVPDSNIIIVSDAISAAGLGPGRYELADQVVHVDPDGAAWSADRTHFAGCATTLPAMLEILTKEGGFEPRTALRWMTENPQRLLDGRST